MMMYVSYGLNVAIGIATFIISYIIFNSLKAAFIAIIVALVVLSICTMGGIYICLYDPKRNRYLGINLFYINCGIKGISFSMALYKAFAIEGPSITRGYLIRLVCESRNTQHAFLLMAFGLSLLVELLRNAP
jgi:hypothetical protein